MQKWSDNLITQFQGNLAISNFTSTRPCLQSSGLKNRHDKPASNGAMVSLHGATVSLHGAMVSLYSTMVSLHGTILSLHGLTMSLQGTIASLHGFLSLLNIVKYMKTFGGINVYTL